jgi:hypothetical protein
METLMNDIRYAIRVLRQRPRCWCWWARSANAANLLLGEPPAAAARGRFAAPISRRAAPFVSIP